MIGVHPDHIPDGRSGQVYSLMIYTDSAVGADTDVSCLSGDVLIARLSQVQVTIPAGETRALVDVTLDQTGTTHLYFDAGTFGAATADVTVVDTPGLIDVGVPDIVKAAVP